MEQPKKQRKIRRDKFHYMKRADHARICQMAVLDGYDPRHKIANKNSVLHVKGVTHSVRKKPAHIVWPVPPQPLQQPNVTPLVLPQAPTEDTQAMAATTGPIAPKKRARPTGSRKKPTRLAA
ncbi:MAG: hypothetical protein V4526_00820 [Patescibacteria group bacterium]